MTIRIKSRSKFSKLYKSDIWGRLFILNKLTRFAKKWEPRQRTKVTLGNFRGDIVKRTKSYRKRKTIFGKQLAVKQKLLKFYGSIKKKQMIKYLHKSRQAKKYIFNDLIKRLESRLDVVLYRSNLIRSIFESRFFILHNHVWVNNMKINKPMYIVNNSDILSFAKPKYIFRKLKKSSFLWNFCSEYLHVNWRTFKVNKFANAQFSKLNYPFKIKPRRILQHYKV